MLKYILGLIFIANFSHAAYINEVTVLNFPATQAVTKSGTWNIDAILNPVAVTGTFWQAVQPVSGSVSVSNFPATQPISGSVSVSNFPATQAVTGTFWQATQPVSLAAIPLATDAATLSEQQTQTTKLNNIDGKIPSGLTVTAGKLQVEIPSPLAVTGTFWQATQPVSLASIPLATGASTLAEQQTQTTTLNGVNSNLQIVSGAGFTTVVNNGVGSGSPSNALLSGGIYKTSPPTLQDGDASELNLDNKGNLKTSVENTVSTFNVGGAISVDNFPSIQLTAGTLPGVTGNDNDNVAAGNAKQEDFLKIGGYDFDSNAYRVAKFAGDLLQVQDPNTNALLNSINSNIKSDVYFTRTMNTPAINAEHFTGLTSNTAWFDAMNYKFGTITLQGTLATGTVILEGTNDNLSTTGTVIPMKIGSSVIVAPVVAAVAIPVASTHYEFSIKYRYIRFRMATASTGNVTTKILISPSTVENDNVFVTGGTTAVSSGTITTVSTVSNVAAITPSISAGGFPTYHTLISAATTNATLVKSTATMIGSVSVSNPTGTAFYFKMFNLATAPVVGTTVPTFTYLILPNSTRDLPIPSFGTRFNLGLSYSTTVNAPTADTTAITAGQAIININYL